MVSEAGSLSAILLHAGFDDGVHGGELGVHVLGEGHLAAGADEVVLILFDLEVFIADEEVIQEAGCQLAGDGEAAQGQGVHLGIGEGAGGFAEEAVGKGPEDVQVNAGAGGVEGVFLGEVGGKTHGIAEVVPHEAGHNRVQVDDHEGLMGLLVEEDVVDFRVVMGDAQRQPALGKHIGEETGLLLNGEEIVKLASGFLHTAVRIGVGVGDELFVALAGVVEVRDGIEELGGIEIA